MLISVITREGALAEMLSRTTEYALRAVVVLAKNDGGHCTAHRIAEAASVPDQYVSKVLGTLVRAGIVLSQRGPTGGFVLAAPPDRISMLDVVEAVEPLPRINACPLRLEEHHEKLCPLHSILSELVADTEARLKGTTIADLLASTTSPLGGDPPCDGPGGAASEDCPKNGSHDGA